MPAIAIILLIAMFAVIYFDATRFIIPNWLVGGLLLLYPLAVFLAPNSGQPNFMPIDWQMALLAMLCAFAVGYVVFALNLMGGGDVKLIIVLSLWVGWEKLVMFGFYFAFLGGIMSIALLLIRPIIPHLTSKKPPRVLRNKEPVPYGLAIAGAFLLMLMNGQIPVVGL
jgi:prepilin peptidase CpaA